MKPEQTAEEKKLAGTSGQGLATENAAPTSPDLNLTEEQQQQLKQDTAKTTGAQAAAARQQEQQEQQAAPAGTTYAPIVENWKKRGRIRDWRENVRHRQPAADAKPVENQPDPQESAQPATPEEIAEAVKTHCFSDGPAIPAAAPATSPAYPAQTPIPDAAHGPSPEPAAPAEGAEGAAPAEGQEAAQEQKQETPAPAEGAAQQETTHPAYPDMTPIPDAATIQPSDVPRVDGSQGGEAEGDGDARSAAAPSPPAPGTGEQEKEAAQQEGGGKAEEKPAGNPDAGADDTKEKEQEERKKVAPLDMKSAPDALKTGNPDLDKALKIPENRKAVDTLISEGVLNPDGTLKQNGALYDKILNGKTDSDIKREKKEKIQRAIAVLTDLFNATSNLVFASKGALNQYNPAYSMTEGVNRGIEEANKQREANRKAYFDEYIRKNQLTIQQQREARQQAKDDFQQEQARIKNEYEEKLHDLELQLKAQEIDQKKYAAELTKARTEYEKARTENQKAYYASIINVNNSRIRLNDANAAKAAQQGAAATTRANAAAGKTATGTTGGASKQKKDIPNL